MKAEQQCDQVGEQSQPETQTQSDSEFKKAAITDMNDLELSISQILNDSPIEPPAKTSKPEP